MIETSTKTPRFVQPDGSLIVQPQKIATLMGNRGTLGPVILQRPQPHASSKPWITCVLKENGKTLPKTSVSYTKLFFLDEVTAFAAGHRPCCECQPERYDMFLHYWKKYIQKDTSDFDIKLHQNRCNENGSKKTIECQLGELPSGVMVMFPGSTQPYLLLWNKLFPWSIDGYGSPVDRSMVSDVTVLTPSLIVKILQNGFPLLVNREETIHPSVLGYH